MKFSPLSRTLAAVAAIFAFAALPASAQSAPPDAGAGISGSGMVTYFGVFVGQSLTDTDLNPRVTVRIARDF